MEDNKKIKETLLHYINLEYYANGLDEEFQTLLKELEDRCAKAILSLKSVNTKKSYSVIMKLIKEEVEEFRKELEERLEEEAEAIMQQELEFLDKLYNKSDSKKTSLNEDKKDEKENESEDNKLSNKKREVSKTTLVLGGITLSKLLFAPIDGRDITAQFVERIAKNIKTTYDTAVRSGYIFGQKSEDIANQAEKSMEKISRGMRNGIITVIPSYAKTTDRIIFLNNNAEVVYCAVLDGRTCIVCGNNHGLHYNSISEAPSLPQHFLCRCVYVMASGVTKPMPTYEEFIDSLPDEEQYDILGKARYEYHKNGVHLERFINNGKKLTLEELRKNLSTNS